MNIKWVLLPLYQAHTHTPIYTPSNRYAVSVSSSIKLLLGFLFFFPFYFIVDRQCAALINNEPDFIQW